MTDEANTAPPAKRRRPTKPRSLTAQELKERAEAELVRWTPEEVVEKQLLPYRSVKVLRRKCNRREVIHHGDGGRITFTAEDIRRENERTTVQPFAPAA